MRLWKMLKKNKNILSLVSIVMLLVLLFLIGIPEPNAVPVFCHFLKLSLCPPILCPLISKPRPV